MIAFVSRLTMAALAAALLIAAPAPKAKADNDIAAGILFGAIVGGTIAAIASDRDRKRSRAYSRPRYHGAYVVAPRRDRGYSRSYYARERAYFSGRRDGRIEQRFRNDRVERRLDRVERRIDRNDRRDARAAWRNDRRAERRNDRRRSRGRWDD